MLITTVGNQGEAMENGGVWREMSKSVREIEEGGRRRREKA